MSPELKAFLNRMGDQMAKEKEAYEKRVNAFYKSMRDFEKRMEAAETKLLPFQASQTPDQDNHEAFH